MGDLAFRVVPEISFMGFVHGFGRLTEIELVIALGALVPEILRRTADQNRAMRQGWVLEWNDCVPVLLCRNYCRMADMDSITFVIAILNTMELVDFKSAVLLWILRICNDNVGIVCKGRHKSS